jgi:hypothetical protein
MNVMFIHGSQVAPSADRSHPAVIESRSSAIVSVDFVDVRPNHRYGLVTDDVTGGGPPAGDVPEAVMSPVGVWHGHSSAMVDVSVRAWLCTVGQTPWGTRD